MRTLAGTDHQARTSFDTASNATGAYAPLTFIAITENSDAPAAGNVALAGELSGQGLDRAQAAYAHSNGTNTVLMTKTFTITSAPTKTPAKGALFNAGSGGTMGYETPISDPPPLAYSGATGDSMAVDWTFSL